MRREQSQGTIEIHQITKKTVRFMGGLNMNIEQQK